MMPDTERAAANEQQDLETVSDTESRPEAYRKGGYAPSSEQKVRVGVQSTILALASVFLITGGIYWGKARDVPLEKHESAAEGLLITALCLSICALILAFGLYHAIIHDISYTRIQDERDGLIDVNKDQRRSQDKLLAVLCVCGPLLMILVAGALASSTENEPNAVVRTITACEGSEPISDLPALRKCPVYGGRAPEKQLYLQKCRENRVLSCCTRREADEVMALNEEFLTTLRGDKYEDGLCRSVLETLMCWVCSPDQELFYKDGRVNVCPRMCDKVLDVCSDTVYDHSVLSFSQIFSTGAELCSNFNLGSSGTCGCYDAYPGVCASPSPTRL